MRKELTFTELDAQTVELLPARETLLFFAKSNWAAVHATNSSLAFNAGTIHSFAASQANQAVIVSQS